MFLFVLSVCIALSVTFCCNLLEACLLSLSSADIASMSEKTPLRAEIWRRFKDDIQKPIAVILIVNTFSLTIGAAISAAQFSSLYGHEWVWVYSVLFSLVMIQWTELVPKSLGVMFNRVVATWAAVPLKGAIAVLAPLVAVMEWINRPFRFRHRDGQADTLNDIQLLARFATINKQLTREQEDIVSRSIKLSGAVVRDIMVERNEIKVLSTKMKMVDALIEAHLHHHTRYILVKEDDLDRVVGYVNVKDIVSALKINPIDPSLSGIARPVIEVQADQKVTTLLTQLTKGYQHMAVVKNTAGQTVGLVTLEDVLEAIVGDLEDEYDLVPAYVHKLSDVRYLVGGGITLRGFAEITGFDVPATDVQLGDWLCERLPRTPAVETKIQVGAITFIIRKVRRSKIHEVIVERGPQG